ncbi:hypothetical protein ElyMa_000113700 [Elysia marginata]|uniref:Uncharacterized protein n=1 Tax=Elysia marginata TaxID=1093978 RepID=A0AAV4EMS1_9GAST|nr:hypothetical protein ElyMa_000113700 [Elysia marginata]
MTELRYITGTVNQFQYHRQSEPPHTHTPPEHKLDYASPSSCFPTWALCSPIPFSLMVRPTDCRSRSGFISIVQQGLGSVLPLPQVIEVVGKQKERKREVEWTLQIVSL